MPVSESSSALPGFYSREFVSDPYAAYDYLRRTGPVRRIHRAGVRVWLVTSYDEVRLVLTDQRFVKEPARWPVPIEEADPGLGGLARFVGKHLLYSDPPGHTRLRRLVSKTFTPGRVAEFEPMIRTVVDELLKQFDVRDEIDLVGWFAVPIGTTVICEILGIPAAERKDFRRWSLPLVSDDESARSGAELAAGRRAALAQLSDYLGARIRQKRARPTPDLLSALIQARDGDARLSETELVAMALLLLIAGHETTVNLIGNGMLALLTHPDQAELLRRRPDLIPGAIEELVRYEGSVMICSLRVTGEPVELAGVRIPEGELVMAVVAAADRDPARFDDPQRLDVTRPSNPHLGFGAGAHYCVGAPLARLQSRIAIGELLRRYPRMELAVPRQELSWHPSISLRGLHALPVAPHGRPAYPAMRHAAGGARGR
ncbi:cytochrome P450 family protein [Nonomuraea sp. CA-141351]|uniref:cytochrome P450 family protein n=1 Tax=Nonomuraea sp. CA-141351 TaxID=3239996 RepID=UPI003D8E3230